MFNFKKHSNLFRKNGYTSLQTARVQQNFSYQEVADMINEPIGLVTACFGKLYLKVDWKVILKVAEILGVSRGRYLKPECSMPADVSEFYDILVGTKVTYPKAEPKKREKYFVTDMTNKVVALASQGKGTREIAQLLGCSIPTVVRYKHKAGLTLQRNMIPSATKARIVELARNGATYAEIGIETGINASSVGSMLSKYRKTHKDLPSRLPPMSEGTAKKIVALYREGYTGKDIIGLGTAPAHTVYKAIRVFRATAKKDTPAVNVIASDQQASKPTVIHEKPSPRKGITLPEVTIEEVFDKNQWILDVIDNIDGITEITVKAGRVTTTVVKGE